MVGGDVVSFIGQGRLHYCCCLAHHHFIISTTPQVYLVQLVRKFDKYAKLSLSHSLYAHSIVCNSKKPMHVYMSVMPDLDVVFSPTHLA